MDRTFRCRGESTSRIVAGAGVESRLPELIGELRPDGVVIVHDPALAALAERVATSIAANATVPIDPRPPAKSLDNAGRLADALLAAGATRGTVLVAIGGGTTTDLAGFVGSIYLRGLPFVSCPTTTLAMCDAALGGKNGVDHQGLKNRLGTIRQPELIVADTDWLRSLPDPMFREGLVEVVKKAAVLDAADFARLEQLAPALLDRDADATLAAVTMAIDMKMAIVLADEREQDRRRALNFGHTIGHALEALAQGHLPHGLAVAMGLIAECRAAAVADNVTDRILALLTAIGVTTRIPIELADEQRLWDVARHDKKAVRGTTPMFVPRRIGDGTTVELTREGLRRALV
jgi:3-dehydroquinate synthase